MRIVHFHSSVRLDFEELYGSVDDVFERCSHRIEWCWFG